MTQSTVHTSVRFFSTLAAVWLLGGLVAGVPAYTDTVRVVSAAAATPSVDAAINEPKSQLNRQLPMTGRKKVVWSVKVKNRGGQRAIDACRGGLTRWGTVYGKAYYAIHVHCGGAPILRLKKGDIIKIDGRKKRVVSSRVVRKGAKVTAVHGMKGSALLQTCYRKSNKMRVVGVVSA